MIYTIHKTDWSVKYFFVYTKKYFYDTINVILSNATEKESVLLNSLKPEE